MATKNEKLNASTIWKAQGQKAFQKLTVYVDQDKPGSGNDNEQSVTTLFGVWQI